MPDAFHHRFLPACVLALALLLASTGGAASAQPESGAAPGEREVRPAPGGGQRGLVALPAWAVWSAGAALFAAAARTLWLLARSGGRS